MADADELGVADGGVSLGPGTTTAQARSWRPGLSAGSKAHTWPSPLGQVIWSRLPSTPSHLVPLADLPGSHGKPLGNVVGEGVGFADEDWCDMNGKPHLCS